MGPAPISWQASQHWDGDVGLWSSFALRVGNPRQTVRVIPSTAGISTWVIAPSGCPPSEPGISAAEGCPESRGGLFNATQSSSWHALGHYSLGIDANLGYGDLTALYGQDTITFGFSDSIGRPELESQVVTALTTDDYLVGLFGLNHQAVNLTNFTDPLPSALGTMKKNNMIPSLSWAYTAGALYQSKGTFGSMTFGGYDASRLHPNSLSFTLAPDVTRDLVIGLQLIHATTANQPFIPLLPSPIYTFIDSTQPFIYLPVESCQEFEHAFGLVWNATDEVYWVNNTLHQTLLLMNPTITFSIGNTKIGGPTVDIIFPYASFDLNVTSPAVDGTVRVFPLQRAANSTQYTLGRTFLQEAYVITDYERSNFSVSQARFEDGLPDNVVTIHSSTSSLGHINHNDTIIPGAPRPTSSKVIIGSSVGAAVLLLLLFIVATSCIRQRRRKLQQQQRADIPERPETDQDRRSPINHSIHEIGNNSIVGFFRELADSSKAELQDEQSRSGSRNKNLGITESSTPSLHELRTNRSSHEKLLMEAIRAHTSKISKATNITNQSRFSATTASRSSCVESVEAASAQQSVLHSSTGSVGLKIQIYASYLRESPDLDRSLPPTPISESPMVSPLTPRFKKRPASRRVLQNVDSAQNLSVSTYIAPLNLRSKILGTTDAHKPGPQDSPLTTIGPNLSPSLPGSALSAVSPLSDRTEAERTTWI